MYGLPQRREVFTPSLHGAQELGPYRAQIQGCCLQQLLVEWSEQKGTLKSCRRSCSVSSQPRPSLQHQCCPALTSSPKESPVWPQIETMERSQREPSPFCLQIPQCPSQWDWLYPVNRRDTELTWGPLSLLVTTLQKWTTDICFLNKKHCSFQWVLNS